MIPPVPKNESERLQALLSYEILDTNPEDKFDDLVKLASQICDTPISLVSLIDNDRQWFKAKVGLDADETPRDVAFCAHAIMDDKPFIIPDASKDERFANNPLVTGAPDIRFYAGIPLQTPSGHNLGTLCVIDQKPRQLNENQVFALKTLADQVISQMELSLKFNELQGALKEVNQQKTTLESTNEKLNDTIKRLTSTQQQLIQSEKMASLGLLTAGIAHEINNPVNFVSAGIQTLSEIVDELIGLLINYEKLNDCDTHHRNAILTEIKAIKDELETTELIEDAQQMMHDIQAGANRATEIVKSLQEFSGMENEKPKPVDINVSIRAGLTLLRTSINRKGITLKESYDDLPKLHVHKNQLNRAFMNIVRNAIQAVEEKGNAAITVCSENLPKEIKVTISDNGIGISKENLSKVFDPFFTTKGIGQGSGLGLSMSYGIIENNGGRIELESEEGKGTTFKLYFPKVSPAK